jgi:ABC-type uncharacterized transport system permease subunit
VKTRAPAATAGLFGLVLTLSGGLAIAVAVLATWPDPGAALAAFFGGPFGDLFAFGNMLDTAVPLTIAGLGIVVSFRAGVFNLGGEGQVYGGGILAAALCTTILPEGWGGSVAAMAAAAALGAAIAGVSGWLRYRWDANELISSYLLSAIVLLVGDWLITGPLDDPASNLMAARGIAPGFWLAEVLAPSHLNTGFALALTLAALMAGFLERTRWGYELRLCGANPGFARYGGVHVGLYLVLPMVLSGALHGLAGATTVLGTYHRAVKGFSLGLGWNAIAVALIARNRPWAVIPAALFYAWLDAGARAATVLAGVSYEMILIVQAVIFYLVTAEALAEYVLARSRAWSTQPSA